MATEYTLPWTLERITEYLKSISQFDHGPFDRLKELWNRYGEDREAGMTVAEALPRLANHEAEISALVASMHETVEWALALHVPLAFQGETYHDRFVEAVAQLARAGDVLLDTIHRSDIARIDSAGVNVGQAMEGINYVANDLLKEVIPYAFEE